MQKIIAIGGGEIGRPGYPIETTIIDKEIIKLSNKKKPKLLFIPTASSDSEGYYETVKKYFGKKLGCETDVLYLLKKNLTYKQIEKKILSSDIVYVGGGNTLKLMNIWKKYGVDKILKKAIRKAIVLSGISAGSICWFNFGNSDSRKFVNKKAGLIRVTGLGIINALNCPHYDFEKERKADLKKMMKRTSGVAIAVDNCCALEIIGDDYRIISSKKTANAYKVYWQAGKFNELLIKKDKKFRALADLLTK
jgi:dipeptidase E